MAANYSISSLIEDYDAADDNGETRGVLMLVIRPSICGLGFVTNILSLMVFLQPSMRNLSCSVYLATKAISDFTFLLATFIVWLTSVDMGLFNTEGVCQLVVFALYLTAFMSIWLVVVLTIENLLCMVKPWFVQRFCNARSARILTIIIVVLGIALYHFALWINGLRSQSQMEDEKIVDVDYFDFKSVSREHSGIGGNFRPLKESVLIQKIVNAQSVAKPENFTHFESFNVIRKSTIFISDKVSQADVGNFSTLNVAKDPRQPITSGLNNYYVPGMPNSTNTSSAMETRPTACLPREEFGHFAVALTYVDSLMTLLVPLIILSVTNTAIIVLALRASRNQRRRDLQKSFGQSSNHQPPALFPNTSCAKNDSPTVGKRNCGLEYNIGDAISTETAPIQKFQRNVNDPRDTCTVSKTVKRSTRASLEAQASRFLFSVSMTLLVFHMPSHLVRLKYVLQFASPLDVVLFRWFETLYITHYALGFFVYISFGKNFRKVFVNLLGRG